MPCNYKNYPSNWKTEIRPRILARAGEVRDGEGKILVEAKCEICGAPNHTTGARDITGEFYDMEFIAGSGELYEFPEDVKPIKIILTIAHILNPDPQDCRDENLKALCQKCHNSLDAPMRAKNAKATNNKKKGLQELF